MEKRCKICGRMTANAYTVIVKHEDKELGTYDACENCLKCMGLVEVERIDALSDFEDDFKETFGNAYLGSDFI